MKPVVIVREMPGDWWRASADFGARVVHVCGPNKTDVRDEARKYVGEVTAALRAHVAWQFARDRRAKDSTGRNAERAQG